MYYIKSYKPVEAKIKINNLDVSATFDSGAGTSIINDKILKKLKSEMKVMTNGWVVSASKDRIPIDGTIRVLVQLGEMVKEYEFKVVKDFVKDVLIGVDILEEFGLVLNFKRRMIWSEDDNSLEIPFSISNDYNETFDIVRAKNTTIIPPHQMMLVQGVTKTTNKEVVMIEEGEFWNQRQCYVGRTLSSIKQGEELLVMVMNTSDKEIKIKSNRKIAQLTEVVIDKDENQEVLSMMNDNSRSNNQQWLKDKVKLKDSKISEEQKQKLLNLLGRYSRVFEKPDKMGITKVKHFIQTTQNKPFKLSQYKLSHKEHEQIDKMTQDMEKQGVISKSDSPWSSPVVLVKKKDGSVRFCVDFRSLNSITKKDGYPLPIIEDYLSVLGKAKYFTVVDLVAGYWQIQLDENDRQKTAFSTRNNHWEFNVMPFGLSGAPATFQRAMDVLLSGCLWQYALVYLDDIIIFSETWEKHLQHIDDVLQRLDKSNFRIKLEKCQFAMETVKFLGHVVSKEGLKMDPEKVMKMRNSSKPRNIKELQRFLGLCNYYRKFVKNFAQITKPLYDLQTLPEWNWNEHCNNSFDQLIKELTTEPIVSFPDFNQKFILETDASDYAIGAVLSQEINGKSNVISYYSKVLSKHQRNYSVTEKECLAVVKAVQHFRQYLFGQQFKIITDHECLTWLKMLKQPAGRLTRWMLALQEFKFEIIYRRGKENIIADALTREPIVRDVYTIFKDFDMALEQWSDPDLQPLIKFLLTNKLPHDKYQQSQLLAMKEHYMVDEKKVLLHINKISSKEIYYQIVVPELLRSLVIRSSHSDTLAGHFGFRRTFETMNKKYYWDSMYLDTRNFIKACIDCQQVKIPRSKKLGLLKSITTKEPFEMIGMDFMGPLKITERGNKYILVITDYFTKWAEAWALKEQTAEEVARVLVTEFLPRHGVPMKILTDQGSQFRSNLLKELCKLLKIKKVETTAYHPQCDGQTERFNGTLKQLIQFNYDNNKHDWDEWLSLALFAYRRSVNPVTGYSPFYLLHGREPKIPLDTIIKSDVEMFSDTHTFIQDLVVRLQEIYEDVAETTNLEKKRQQQQYNKHRQDIEFNEKDYVLLKRIKIPGQSKFRKPYIGPYRIKKKLSSLNYRLEDLDGKERKQTAHVDRLKGITFNNITPWKDDTDGTGEEEEEKEEGEEIKNMKNMKKMRKMKKRK